MRTTPDAKRKTFSAVDGAREAGATVTAWQKKDRREAGLEGNAIGRDERYGAVRIMMSLTGFASPLPVKPMSIDWPGAMCRFQAAGVTV